MTENCNNDCGSCSSDCAERKSQPPVAKMNDSSSVKKTIAVVSGKGGVGKSLVTALLASKLSRRGKKCAVLDADITGPSIPKLFGLTERCQGSELGIFPVISRGGIKIVSINSLLDNETDPVLWRGPIIAGTVRQFYEQTVWNDLDYLLVDMPPGTGDVPLTVFQSLSIDGVIVVTSPQELVTMIVAKAVNMAKMMNIPVLGLVENMAWFQCDGCGKKHAIFGESRIDEAAKQFGIESTACLPLDGSIAKKCDAGAVEDIDGDWLDALTERLEAQKPSV